MNVLVALLSLVIPLGLGTRMPVPDDNPVTEEKIAQGRQLFSDTRLSRDGTVSCATCHDPARAFSKPDPVTPGVFGRKGARNAPTLVNLAWASSFFWDGRAFSLEEQVLKPIADPNEMDLDPAEAARRVGLTRDELGRRLATYVRSLLSGNSRYDRYMNGDRTALTDEEQRGLRLFTGRGMCLSCHDGPHLSDGRAHNTGLTWQPADERAGTPGRFLDRGAEAISGRATEVGAFKTPTLRDVSRTAPYMHDGSLSTLEEVVDFYDRGGRPNPNLDREMRPLEFTEDAKRALVAFLKTLDGR